MVVQQKGTAAAGIQTNAFGLIIHGRDVPAPEPALGQPEVGPYRLLFRLLGLDIMVGTARAAIAASSAPEAQPGIFSSAACTHFTRFPIALRAAGCEAGRQPRLTPDLPHAPKGSEGRNRTGGRRQRKLNAPDFVERSGDAVECSVEVSKQPYACRIGFEVGAMPESAATLL